MKDRALVPFFSNTEDNSHCFQAALRMVLGFFRPEVNHDWKELDRVTAHTANYTWPAAGLVYCASIGFDIELIEDFDYDRFCAEGYDYLVEISGKEVADDQKRNSNLEQEMKLASRLKSVVRLEQRVPVRKDFVDMLEKGAVVICNVNSCALVEEEGYTGHFVVVIGIGKQGVRLHDPGLPPKENLIVSWGRFDRAWSYPDTKARNIIAFTSNRAER